jgi:NAD(P)-dependent dehydrogenase (short-subunit alcohol dehydrogenase family)
MAAAAASAAAAAASSTLFSVAGKNVLVTGGSRGIGYMIAKGFQQHGAHVLLTSRSEDACRQAAQELQCDYVVSDLSSRAGCEALALKVGQHFDNRLHVLVNNAGAAWGEPLERESSHLSNWGWDKVLDLNVKSLFYLTRACLPYLEAAAVHGEGAEGEESNNDDDDDPARVINIGSVAGIEPQSVPTHAYDVSKAAVHHLTRKLAYDLASKHITVNALAPGYVPSRMSASLATWGADAQHFSNNVVPLGRMGRDDDMAGACIYLSSRAGSYVTGTILTVDGGVIGARSVPVSSSL